jgi:hypothetical protein
MRSRRAWLYAGAAVVVTLVLACVGFGIGSMFVPDDPKAGPSTSVVETTSAPVPTSSGLSAEGRRAYLDSLGAIDPGLIANEDRAIRRAEETCADLLQGWSGDQLADRVVTRLSGGSAQIDRAQAVEAIALMKRWVCS